MASIFALTQKMTESSCGPHFTVKIHTQFLNGNRFHDSGNSKFFGRSSLLLWNVMETANFRLLIYSCTWIEFHWILSTFLWLPSRLAISVSFQTAHAASQCDWPHLNYCFNFILLNFLTWVYPFSLFLPGYSADEARPRVCELHHYFLFQRDLCHGMTKILLEWRRDFCLPFNILAIDFKFNFFSRRLAMNDESRRWTRTSGES